jgi:hypothetical protein
MIRVQVYNQGGHLTNSGTFDSLEVADQWISECENRHGFGPVGQHTVVKTDLDTDAVYIAELKADAILELKFEIDRIVGSMYSVSEMVMLSLSGAQDHQVFLEMKGTLLAAYEEADPIIISINACTTQEEIEAIKNSNLTIIGEQIWL